MWKIKAGASPPRAGQPQKPSLNQWTATRTLAELTTGIGAGDSGLPHPLFQDSQACVFLTDGHGQLEVLEVREPRRPLVGRAGAGLELTEALPEGGVEGGQSGGTWPRGLGRQTHR